MRARGARRRREIGRAKGRGWLVSDLLKDGRVWLRVKVIGKFERARFRFVVKDTKRGLNSYYYLLKLFYSVSEAVKA